MIVLEESSSGVILPVKAQPGARRSAIVGEHAGMLKVAVNQPAEKGRANEAICAVLADQFQVKRGQVTLITGATSSQKKFSLSGISLSELRVRIESLLEK